jgi:hypothetical protein
VAKSTTKVNIGDATSEVASVLKALPPKEADTGRAVIERSREFIQDAVSKGYTVGEVAAIIARDTSVKASVTTIKQYIKQLGIEKGKSSGTERVIPKKKPPTTGHANDTKPKSQSTTVDQHAASRRAGRGT